MIKKKGEMTTQQIVMLIVLIVSFAIILFFLFRLNLGKTTESEVCRNSVLMKGNAALPDEVVALNCKTSYVCLTEDGSCESLTTREVEKVKTKDDVYEVLANEMMDCWWMFGEGKVDYVGKDLKEKRYCSICSHIAFDNSLVEDTKFFDNEEIDEEDFYIYMENHNVSGGDVNYLEYLFEISKVSEIKDTLIENGKEFKMINLNKQQYIMMGISSEVSVGGWIAAGAGIAAGVAGTIVLVVASPLTGFTSLGAIPSVIFTVSSAVAGGIGGGYYAGIISKGESGNNYLKPAIIEINPGTLKALKCDDIKTLA